MVDVRWHLGEKLRQTWLGKCWGMFVRAKGMTVSFIEKSDLKEETNGNYIIVTQLLLYIGDVPQVLRMHGIWKWFNP